jgi:hypothetical protein
MVTAMLRERMGESASYVDMAREINGNKTRIARDLQRRYPGQFPSLEALQNHLGIVAEELRYAARGNQDLQQQRGPVGRVISAITAPFRHPIKTAGFLLKAGIIAGLGIIGLRLFAPSIEDFLAGVGLERLNGAFRAAFPSGSLSTAPNPGLSPGSPGLNNPGGPT